MKISIVIPNYNGINLLMNNLHSVVSLQKKYPQICEIIIVDDYSSDQSIDYINKHHPNIKVVKKLNHSGYSDSVNNGVNSATCDLVLLLNTDILIESVNIPELISYFKNEKVFAVGLLDKSVEKDGIVERGRGLGNFHNGLLVHKRGETDKNNTLWVSGGSGIFDKKIWEKLGGMDTLFSPFYWEDIDLSYRALKSGYKIYFDKDQSVIHKHQQGSILSNYSYIKIKQISLRNQILFVWKNISDKVYIKDNIKYLITNLFKSLIKFDFTFFKAFVCSLIRLPEALNKKRISSRLWQITDQEVLEQFIE